MVEIKAFSTTALYKCNVKTLENILSAFPSMLSIEVSCGYYNDDVLVSFNLMNVRCTFWPLLHPFYELITVLKTVVEFHDLFGSLLVSRLLR